jgi:zinc/manganese transport system substrate-binding protein
MRRIFAALAVGSVAIAMEACGSAPGSTTPGVVKVVAGENFWANIAGQIGGHDANVTSILINPNADPHLYETSAADAVDVAEARLVIENGAGYDTWLAQLLGATTHQGRLVVNVQRILGKTGSDVNPHFWYDIPKVPEVARAVEGALAKLEPKDAKTFAANLASFERSLDPIDAVIDEIRSRYPSAPVAYTERVPGYLVEAAGLDVLTPVGFAAATENGNEPSPADSLAMDQLITDHRVKVLLYNAQTVSAVTEHVRALAEQAKVPVVAVTETLPPSYRSYQAWQLAQAKAILRALGG